MGRGRRAREPVPAPARGEHDVRDLEHPAPDWVAFTRFPTWMWRNQEVRELVDWLRERNRGVPPERRAGFYGLDLYSLHTSIGAVLAYLDEVDLGGGPMEVKRVRPAHPRSYEHVCHATGLAGFLLGLRPEGELRTALVEPRLERAIGVIYRPETEMASHYFAAHLPLQFDEYAWIDETRAVTPLASREVAGLAETYPFGV